MIIGRVEDVRNPADTGSFEEFTSLNLSKRTCSDPSEVAILSNAIWADVDDLVSSTGVQR